MKNILGITTNSRKRLYVSPQVHVILEDMDVELLETSDTMGGEHPKDKDNTGGNEYAKETSGFYQPYTVDFDDDSDF